MIQVDLPEDWRDQLSDALEDTQVHPWFVSAGVVVALVEAWGLHQVVDARAVSTPA